MKPRVTTTVIAREAGVHQTTVSLALRGDKRLSPETVTRIRAVAARLGYVPDPMLAALASYRKARRPGAMRGSVAWVTNWSTRDSWAGRPMFREFFQGAHRRAGEMGYQLEEFWLNEPGLTPGRAAKILYARGVQGLVLPPQPDGVSTMEFEWEWFSVVTIGPTLRTPELHLVSNSQFRTVARLCEALGARGYQRIGYAIDRIIDDRMDAQWSAAFDRYQRDLPPARQTRRFELTPTKAGLAVWLAEERPDVVFGCSEQVGRWVRTLTAGAVDFAILGSVRTRTDDAGMFENAERVGEMAVERVASLIQLGERGVPATATRLLIDATLELGGLAGPRRNPA